MIAGGALLAACAASPATTPRTCALPPAALAADGAGSASADDVHAILAARCAVGGCHLSAPGAGNLVLAGSAWTQRVVGVPSQEAPSLVLVAPGDPENSWLARKVFGEPCDDACAPGLGCGIQMPFGTALSDADQQTIVAWIAAGAPD